MHWLAGEFEAVAARAEALAALRRRRAAGEDVPRREEARARAAFRDRLGELVEAVSRRPGVLGCVAAHEGLLVAAAGDAPDFEAVAAVAQSAVLSGHDAADKLRLGDLRQVLVVGERGKLAVLRVGDMTVGVLAPEEVSLAAALG